MRDDHDTGYVPFDWSTGEGGKAPETPVTPGDEASSQRVLEHALPTADGRHSPHFRVREPSRATDGDARAGRGRFRSLLVFSVTPLVLVAAIGWSQLRPIEITVGDTPIRVAAATTVEQAVERAGLPMPAGSLVSVEGDVLVERGGSPATVLVNGRPTAPQARVHSGDVITVERGRDATEPLVAVQVGVPYSIQERASGKPGRVARNGEEGLVLVYRGRISGSGVATETLWPPVDRIVEVGSGAKVTNGEKLVALTFDDGPWRDQTTRILDILDRYEVPATFFMLGSRVKIDPATAREVTRRGYAVASHSFTHEDLTKLSATEVRSEIARTNTRIQGATGVTPKWFRAPGGAVNPTVRSAVSDAGMKVAHWTLGTGDWSNKGSDRVVRIVTQRIKPGDVVLLHDGGGPRDQTIEALPRIIENLQSRGYRFVTLDELDRVPGTSARY